MPETARRSAGKSHATHTHFLAYSPTFWPMTEDSHVALKRSRSSVSISEQGELKPPVFQVVGGSAQCFGAEAAMALVGMRARSSAKTVVADMVMTMPMIPASICVRVVATVSVWRNADSGCR